METGEILRQFSEAEGLPKEAILAASERREEIAPILIRAIEDYVAGDLDDETKRSPVFFIFHLLGEWREKSAYRPLSRLLQCAPSKVDAAISDAITSTSHQVMAAVFDGDPEPLYDIILNPEADEFVRSRMCEVLAMLVLSGELDRGDAARFLRDGFANFRPQRECFLWHGWQSAIALLGLSEFKSIVKKAFDRGLISSQWLGFDDFKQDLDGAIKDPGAPRHEGDREFTLFGDTIEELSTWYCFTEKYQEDMRRAEEARSDDAAFQEPATNPYRGVGRNDPCPCGSGKKFKKCCLRTGAPWA